VKKQQTSFRKGGKSKLTFATNANDERDCAMSAERNNAVTELTNSVGNEHAEKLVSQYERLTDRIRKKKKNKTSEYQTRKGLEEVLLTMGLSKDTMDELKNSLRPSTDREHYIEIISRKDGEIAGLKKQIATMNKK